MAGRLRPPSRFEENLEENMKQGRKVLALLLALAMVFAMATPALADGGDDPSKATITGTIDPKNLSDTMPANVTVNIHKLQADKYNTTEGYAHNGGELTTEQLGQLLGTTVSELDGVTFTYYEVTAKQLEAFKANPGEYDTVEEVNAVAKVTTTQKVGTETQDVELPRQVATVTTANKQGASVSLPTGGDEGRYYWFVESGFTSGDTPEKQISSSIAVPFGLSLPAMNPEGNQYLTVMHIYPKNVTGVKPEPDKTVKDLVNKNASYNVGDTVTWYLHASIPGNIADYETLTLTDDFEKELTYVGNVVVKYGKADTFDALGTTLVKDTDYTITETPADGETKAKLVITFKEAGIAKLAGNYVADGEVVASVDTKINENAKMGLDIPNNFTLTFKNRGNPEEKPDVPEEKRPKVNTGGKVFKKVEAGTTDNRTPLAGAVFVLKDGDNDVVWTQDLFNANKTAILAGKFVKAGGTGNNPTYSKFSDYAELTDNAPIYFISDETGDFEIKGLEYSSWQKMKWDKDQGAMVADGAAITHDYKLKEVKAPDGFALLNSPIGFTVDATSYYTAPAEVASGDAVATADPLEIENKKVTIPQTGGMGTVIFSVVGIAVMAFAIVAYQKNKKAEA